VKEKKQQAVTQTATFHIGQFKLKVALPQGATGFKLLNIIGEVHPDIHPEDAACAITARLKEKAKGQRVEEILDDLFLQSFRELPVAQWSSGRWQTIRDRTIATGGWFLTKLVRATVLGSRKAIFDAPDLFILKNWRCLRPRNWRNCHPANLDVLEQLPGLNDWSPIVAVELMRLAGVPQIKSTEQWYAQRRERRGLPGKSNYRVNKDNTTFLSDGGLKIDDL
jgi:hypothetical protein